MPETLNNTNCRHTSLSHDFVAIRENASGGRIYYGGDQAWFSRVTQRNGGCSQVAAANILAYLAKSRPAFGGLCACSGEYVEKTEFVRLMGEIYAVLPSRELPFLSAAADRGKHKGLSTLGAASPYRFARRVERFAAQRGGELCAKVLAGPLTMRRLVAFLKDAIEADAPVALLNALRPASMELHGGAHRYHNHWVTVTGMREYGSGRVELDVSSWGERYTLPLDQFFQKSRVNASLSAVYFSPRET